MISHQNNFGTNLTTGTSAGDTTSPLNSIPNVAAPFYIAFDATNINGHYEVKKITSKTATNVLHSSLSYNHTTAEEVRMVVPAGEMDDIAYSFSERMFDHVASGCVWSGDSYGSTRAASMTAGVVYIGGERISLSSVSAHSFTASKDTYIDVDNTGTITYTEVTNNAASPALAANSIRLGIIVTGASNIANAGSVNQGEENKILPIASSVPYAVTDSLGNLICPRDPNRKILGYRQITSNISSSSTTPVQIVGLSVPVIVPTGRKIRVTISGGTSIQNDTLNAYFDLAIWDGTVGSGTRLQRTEYRASVPSQLFPILCSVINSPSTSSKTYNAGFSTDGSSGTVSLNGVSNTSPAFIMVELV